MTHLMGYFLVFGLLALSHTAAAGPGGGKPAEFIIRAEGDMLTLKAKTSPSSGSSRVGKTAQL